MTKRIGIDLGTTNCCAAWMDPDTRRVTVIADDSGPLLPSVIAQCSDGTIVLGLEAKTLENPLYRHAFVKRSIGTTEQYGFRDGPRTATWISAQYLRELKVRAQRVLQGEVEAIVTVPAHFQENHIHETMRAAEEAGLKLLDDPLREPIAAAFAYFEENPSGGDRQGSSKILVYDLGGGTMDATVCRRSGSRIVVGGGGKAYSGDKFLGGVDFDKDLLAMLYAEHGGQHLDAFGKGDNAAIRRPELTTLLLEAEKRKWKLGKATPVVTWSGVLTVQGRPRSFTYSIKLNDFNARIASKIQDSLAKCDEALLIDFKSTVEGSSLPNDAECLRRSLDDLDEIVLVGGSTRVEHVTTLLAEHFRAIRGDKTIPIRAYREDECVAIGAAIYAVDFAGGVGTAQTKGAIAWTTGPLPRVGRDTDVHPELYGRVEGAGPGWTVELRTGHTRQKAPVDSGQFRLPSIPLAEGLNTFEFLVCDDAGVVRDREAHEVRRSGNSTDPVGLAQPIQVRVKGLGFWELLGTGLPRGEFREAKPLYVSDRGIIRLPIYEGPYFLGTVEVEGHFERGMVVRVRTQYRLGALVLRIRVGDAQQQEREVPFEPVKVRTDVKVLTRRFEELVTDASRRLERLTGGYESNTDAPGRSAIWGRLRSELNALRVDIRADLENPMIDYSRIEDRLQRLEQLIFRMDAFQNTPDGVRQRIELAKRMIQQDEKPYPDLVARLGEVESKLGATNDPQLLEQLNNDVNNVFMHLMRNRQVVASEEMIGERAKSMLDRAQAIRASCGDNQEIVRQAGEIEEGVRAILNNSSFNTSQKFNRLLNLDAVLTPLYWDFVERERERGLLAPTP